MIRTCSASRHAVIIATQIVCGEKIEDPEHAAESIHATVDALWKARAANNELLEALLGAVELAEYWINREYTRNASESEYQTWLALGHHSDAMKAARAAIAKSEGK
jgi:hypothetical protein